VRVGDGKDLRGEGECCFGVWEGRGLLSGLAGPGVGCWGGEQRRKGKGMFWCKRFISGSSLARRLRSERDSWNKRTIGRKYRASI